MEFELWWLLPIPAVFFALGWIAARIDIKHLLRESRALPLSYFRGLNFLLNEQPDKAIESFIEVVKVDPQTIDLHFALGSLFRRQGEIDRAIRMHQNLLDRADLPRRQARRRRPSSWRRISIAPGLLDRAEELFTQARRHAVRAPVARASCCRSTSRRRTGRRRSPSTRRMEAHRQAAVLQGDRALLLRARAGGAAASRDCATARGYLDQALARIQGCARATMLLGDLDAQQGRHGRRRSPRGSGSRSQNPAFLALVAERLADAYASRATPRRACACCAAYQQQYPSLDLLNAVFTLTLEQEGADAAGALIKDELRATRRCSASTGCSKRSCWRAPAERRHDLELVKDWSASTSSASACTSATTAAFARKQFYWRCPGCGKWETYSPRRTETPEWIRLSAPTCATDAELR